MMHIISSINLIFVIVSLGDDSCHGKLMSNKLLEALSDVKDLPKITLGAIVERAQGQASLVLCLISILPFMQPIPIPGLSSVLGAVVALQGFGIMVWSKPLLTHGLKQVEITPERFEIIERAAIKFTNLSGKISSLKSELVNSRLSHIFCGASIVICALFLSLPLPIPFSNLIPSLGIFFICLGLLEEDVLLTLMGHGMTIVVVMFSLFSYQLIAEQVRNWF